MVYLRAVTPTRSSDTLTAMAPQRRCVSPVRRLSRSSDVDLSPAPRRLVDPERSVQFAEPAVGLVSGPPGFGVRSAGSTHGSGEIIATYATADRPRNKFPDQSTLQMPYICSNAITRHVHFGGLCLIRCVRCSVRPVPWQLAMVTLGTD